MIKPIFIGITGGTGSGKSTVVKSIMENIPANDIAIIEQDAYYKNQSHLPMDIREKTNYDHPFAFDNDLLIEHLKKLSSGQEIKKPKYDFTNHTRFVDKTELVLPKSIIIVEGIMVLEDIRIRDLLDIKIFVDTDADIRILRRIQRDIKERGRTVDSVIEQYIATVRPSHLQFIEPNKRYADIIIPEGGHNPVAIDLVVSKIKMIIEESL